MCSESGFFVRYCTAAPPASIYSIDYPIVAITRSFVLFRHPSLQKYFFTQFIPLFPPRLSSSYPDDFLSRLPALPYVVFRVSVPFLFRFGPYPPASVRFHPSPPGAAVASPSSGTCCCRSGAAVALPLPRLAAIRVPFSSGVAAFPDPPFLGRRSRRFAAFTAFTTRMLPDA